jgi:SWI/SNF-related matrix-associated actin-dependent regulator 1 of chromatin subfamily A
MKNELTKPPSISNFTPASSSESAPHFEFTTGTGGTPPFIKKPTSSIPASSKQDVKKISTCTIDLLLVGEAYIAIRVSPAEYTHRVVQLVKQIDGHYFNNELKQWMIPKPTHDMFASRLLSLQGAELNVSVNKVKSTLLSATSVQPNQQGIDVSSYHEIPPQLRKALFPFQREGVAFALARNGRALIGDEMGLGKTIQAIAIACCYHAKWPVLVICPSSVRLSWQSEFMRWTPLTQAQIHVVSSSTQTTKGKKTKTDILRKSQKQTWIGGEAQAIKTEVVIISYDLVSRLEDELDKVSFQLVICDESHYLKSDTAKRTKSILPMLQAANHCILLTGTPALSRPVELYTQITAIKDNLVGSKMEYGRRYCGARKGRFGWEFKGAKNLPELHALLKKFIMVRRAKKEVLTQLLPKTRTAIAVDCEGEEGKELKKLMKSAPDLAKALQDAMRQEGNDPAVARLENSSRALLIQLYAKTGMAKLPAVEAYIEDLLEAGVKFLVFAHHLAVLDGIEAKLKRLRVDYFRLDGATPMQKRHADVERFQSDENCRVALLSITAGGTGITLTASSQVVFAELYWTPAILMQVLIY